MNVKAEAYQEYSEWLRMTIEARNLRLHEE
jgi:hypothetical protein